MNKVFYDHLIIREEIDLELEKYDLSQQEREELIQLIDETLHHEILDLILQSMPQDTHEEFLTHFHNNPENEILLDYVKKHSGKDLEKIIKAEAKKVKDEILKTIKGAKKA